MIFLLIILIILGIKFICGVAKNDTIDTSARGTTAATKPAIRTEIKPKIKKITMKQLSFVAVDFETMTAEPTSVCAAGLVLVIEGIVVQSMYTLVKLIPDNRQKLNTFVHGITPEMCERGMDFRDVWQLLAQWTKEGYPIVCHNRNADIRYLEALQDYYNLKGIDLKNNICTYELTGENLQSACEKYNVPFADHHNAHADAMACARVYLAATGYKKPKFENVEPWVGSEKRKISKKTLSIPTDEEIKNKDTIFYRSNCVITGTFSRYEMRETLAGILRELGADINTAISGKTTLVCMGEGAGWKKIEKIEERIADGQQIKVVNEEELYKILDSIVS